LKQFIFECDKQEMIRNEIKTQSIKKLLEMYELVKSIPIEKKFILIYEKIIEEEKENIINSFLIIFANILKLHKLVKL
jgi:hypothetical protein